MRKELIKMFLTKEIEIEVVKMPSIEDVRMITEINHQRVMAENQKKEEERKRAYERAKLNALADLPNFINFINRQIEKSCAEGYSYVSFSIDDTYSTPNGNHDKRCEYIVPGLVSYELIEEINNIYTALGFKSECRLIHCSSPYAYRTGEIDISWRE
jgi:hypothetical protein